MVLARGEGALDTGLDEAGGAAGGVVALLEQGFEVEVAGGGVALVVQGFEVELTMTGGGGG